MSPYGTFSYRPNNLIFVREDFQQLGRSANLATIRRIGSGKSINSPLSVAAMVQQHPMKVGNLDSVLKNPASYKFPTPIPASTPASESLPSRRACQRRQCRAG